MKTQPQPRTGPRHANDPLLGLYFCLVGVLLFVGAFVIGVMGLLGSLPTGPVAADVPIDWSTVGSLMALGGVGIVVLLRTFWK